MLLKIHFIMKVISYYFLYTWNVYREHLIHFDISIFKL